MNAILSDRELADTQLISVCTVFKQLILRQDAGSTDRLTIYRSVYRLIRSERTSQRADT